MNKAKHTPGPWEYIAAERLSHDAPEQGPKITEGGVLGGTEDDPAWVIEGEIEFAPDARARLIAAAPDLLAALQELLGDPSWGCHRPTYLKARAAIAKAIGEP